MADDPKVEPQKTESTKPEAPENHQETPQILRTELKIPQAIIGKYCTEQNKNERRERNRFRVEVLTLIIISFYTAIAAYQGWKMREATDAAQKSADVATEAVKIAKDALDIQKESVEKTLVEMKAQSKTMEISANASGKMATVAEGGIAISKRNIELDQRAWMGVSRILGKPEVNEQMRITVFF